MKTSNHVLAALVAAGATVFGTQHESRAQGANDTAAIRQMIDTLRNDYETRIRDLERRLERAEGAPRGAATAPAPSASGQAAQSVSAARTTGAAPPAGTANANAFNPSINVVLNGTLGTSSRDRDETTISGFALGEEASESLAKGFSLGESEVNFSATIDQVLFGNLTVALTSANEVEVEEAYIQTTSLPFGFTVKAGRFFSGIGYLNRKHAHDWDFVDAPLPYLAMLDGQYGDDGVQITWVAPTSFLLEFGSEAFRGDAFPSNGASRGGVGSQSVFVRLGDDISDNSSWLAAFSYLRAAARARETGTGPDTFTGNTDLGIASLIYKWAPGGNPQRENLTLAGEFFARRESGSFNASPYRDTQNGWYTQAVYQFMPQWKFGLRYDEADAGSVDPIFIGTVLDDSGNTPRRGSALLEYDTSEFGRLRLQYSLDQSSPDTNHVLLLQYTVIFGPHGAHSY